MVRRRTAREVGATRQVCGNVFGLRVEIVFPGHDEFRCVPVLTSRSVVGDHYRYQVSMHAVLAVLSFLLFLSRLRLVGFKFVGVALLLGLPDEDPRRVVKET
jgi:hypothetical protein